MSEVSDGRPRPQDGATQYWFNIADGKLRVIKLVYCVDRPTETLGVGSGGVPLRDEWAVMALEKIDGRDCWRYTARWDYPDWLRRFHRLPNVYSDYPEARRALIQRAKCSYENAQASLSEAGRALFQASAMPEHFTVPEADGP